MKPATHIAAAIGVTLISLGILNVAYSGNLESKSSISISSGELLTPVIELYTSEGCSSCPRADDFLTKLGETINPGFRAVPLAFHVDYWNWLGWEDPFSKSEYAQRQRRIGDINNQGSIYTPELVVAGKEVRGGSTIIENIKQLNLNKASVSIALNLRAEVSDQIQVDMAFCNTTDLSNVSAFIAVYENNIIREIKGGENSGRTLVHNYVVRHWSAPLQLSPGDSINTITLDIEKSWAYENLGLAVVVVNSENGQTLQALNTKLESLFQI